VLAIDELKKLAKMQELLLARTSDNREANLDKYKSIVTQIDEETFSSLLSEIKQIDEHNQNLEDELQFLEQIKSSYQQLLEQQLGFKRVSETYGDENLQLSDLSQIDIDYINKRINNINGYLINKRNIEINKNKLQKLNEELINEEKNRKYISNRLLEFEKTLRNNFINAEGRTINNGKLEYTSVITEYNKLEIDFKDMLINIDGLRALLSKINTEMVEIEEKLKIAEICYNSSPSVDSKQIYDEITLEYYKVKYRLIMIKILNLLTKNYDDFDKFREKREQLLDLIKHRNICLEKLNIKISIDPFARTKIAEQLEMFSSLKDGSKRINQIKKEIARLTDTVEQTEEQNREYMYSINDKQEIFRSTTSVNDIDISGITLDIEDYIDDSTEEKRVSENQVVTVKNMPEHLNMDIVRQKTSRVIARVNEMMNKPTIEIEIEDDIVSEDISPELVIIPSNDNVKEDTTIEINSNLENSQLPSFDNDWFKNWSSSSEEQHNTAKDKKNEEQELIDNNSTEDKEITIEEKKVNVPSNNDDEKENTTIEINSDLENSELPSFDNDWFKNWSSSSEEQYNTAEDKKNEEELIDNAFTEDKEITIEESIETDKEIIFPTVEDSSLKPINSDIFLTVNPFEETQLFTDKVDEDSELDLNDSTAKSGFEIDLEEPKKESNFFDLEIELNAARETDVETENYDFSMDNNSDSFWPVQEDEIENNVETENQEEIVPTFEEQIGALLANDDVKTKKRVA